VNRKSPSIRDSDCDRLQRSETPARSDQRNADKKSRPPPGSLGITDTCDFGYSASPHASTDEENRQRHNGGESSSSDEPVASEQRIDRTSRCDGDDNTADQMAGGN
jgi:hypothetical protein